MQFGLRYCNTGRYADAKEAVALAQAAEAAGFESLWTVEHCIVPADYTSAYPYDPSGKMAGGPNLWRGLNHCGPLARGIEQGRSYHIGPQKDS